MMEFSLAVLAAVSVLLFVYIIFNHRNIFIYKHISGNIILLLFIILLFLIIFYAFYIICLLIFIIQ
ncbi:hypothetical protein AD932_02530 [Gluconobacter oxydans]|nr:hypothetical protein AD932_02530 [Gluconobacter oxydans]